MSHNKNTPDQPGLWDAFDQPEPPSRRSRRPQTATPSASEDLPASAENASVEPERLWRVDDVAAFLGVPKKTLYSWRTVSKGPKGFRVGKHLRWNPHTVLEWAQRQEEEQ